MVTLHVMAMEKYSGKTALCLGLARKLAADGLRVGYMKPLALALRRAEAMDPDAAVMKRSLGLMEPMEVLTPVMLDGETLDWVLAGRAGNQADRISDAFKVASTGKDVMVVEGLNGFAEGAMLGLDNRSVADLLDARCLLALRGCTELCADDVIMAKKLMGDRMLGVVLNAVPRGMVEFATETLAPFVSRRGVKVYAILPEDKMLMAASVGELVDRLGGRVISSPDRMDELAEHVMVGAMSIENALNYFRRKPNKVVITGGDRPDIQLAALETSTKCLVLTGNLHPNPLILGRAEELGIPVVLVQQDTLTAVGLVEQVFSEIRFHQEKKIKRFHRMLDNDLEYEELKRDLGL